MVIKTEAMRRYQRVASTESDQRPLVLKLLASSPSAPIFAKYPTVYPKY